MSPWAAYALGVATVPVGAALWFVGALATTPERGYCQVCPGWEDREVRLPWVMSRVYWKTHDLTPRHRRLLAQARAEQKTRRARTSTEDGA